MSENEIPTRRRFLSSTGALAAAGLLLNPSQAEAQAQAQNSSTRVYKSGETIDDRIAKFQIDGWNVTYDYNSLFNHGGRDIEILLRGGLVTDGEFYRQFKKDGKTYVRMTALPTTTDDRAYLQVFEREGGRIGENRSGKIVAERVYPIALDFHTSGNISNRTSSLGPNAFSIGVFSESAIDQPLLGKVLELYEAFWNIGSDSLPIYILNHNPQEERQFSLARSQEPETRQNAMLVPSFILTEPNFRYEDRGLAMIYKTLAIRLASDMSYFGHPNPKLKAELVAAHESLMHSVGFDSEKFNVARNSDNRNLGGELDRYFNQILGDSRLHVFDADKHADVGGEDFYIGAVRDGKRMYTNAEDFFGSALTSFRYHLQGYKSVLDSFEGLKPEQKKEVARAGMAVLNYFGSFKGPEPEQQLMLVRVLPAYHILKNEFARHLN